jgi:hypothetical protein
MSEGVPPQLDHIAEGRAHRLLRAYRMSPPIAKGFIANTPTGYLRFIDSSFLTERGGISLSLA